MDPSGIPRSALRRNLGFFSMGGSKASKKFTDDGVVAQLVEHHNGIVAVRGSTPLSSTKLDFLYCRRLFFELKLLFQQGKTRGFWIPKILRHKKEASLI